MPFLYHAHFHPCTIENESLLIQGKRPASAVSSCGRVFPRYSEIQQQLILHRNVTMVTGTSRDQRYQTVVRYTVKVRSRRPERVAEIVERCRERDESDDEDYTLLIPAELTNQRVDVVHGRRTCC